MCATFSRPTLRRAKCRARSWRSRGAASWPFSKPTATRNKAGAAMTPDALFNIASMTKPVTAVAALQLYEQGRLLIDDPVSKYFPKFESDPRRVLDEKKEKIVDTVPQKRPITIQDLMRHTSGLIYGGRGTTAVHKMLPEGSGVAGAGMTGAEFIERLGGLPLLHQPGAVWDYGFGLDVLGLVDRADRGDKAWRIFSREYFRAARHERHGRTWFRRQGGPLRRRAAIGAGSGSARSAPAAEIRMRRRVPRGDRIGLSAICADVAEPRKVRRRAHPGAQGGRIHAVGSSD